MDEIVYKCAAYMFSMLVTEPGKPDYDVITAIQNDEGWRVVLRTDVMPARIYEFTRKNDKKNTTISTYINAHTFYTEL